MDTHLDRADHVQYVAFRIGVAIVAATLVVSRGLRTSFAGIQNLSCSGDAAGALLLYALHRLLRLPLRLLLPAALVSAVAGPLPGATVD